MLTDYSKNTKLISLLLSSLIILNYLSMFFFYNKVISAIFAFTYLSLVFIFFLKIHISTIYKLSLIFLAIIAAGTPPIDWDSWAIWLFHAKRIFIEENFFITLNDYANIHNDYPLIVPSFMVSFSNLINGWNLILPKFSIFLLYLPPLIFAEAAFNKKVNLLVLIFTTLNFNVFLFNGYIDGLVAIYFSFSVYLLFKIFFEEKENVIEYIILCCFLTILSVLKNEGFVLVLIILSLLIFKNLFNKKKIIKLNRHILIYLSLIPYILWRFVSTYNGVQTDLFDSANFERIVSYSIFIKTFYIIIQNLFFNINTLLSIILLLLSFYFCKNKRLLNITVYCSLVYILILFTIYTVTPHNLEWHLNTSSDRVLMSLHYLIFLSSLLSFNKILKIN